MSDNVNNASFVPPCSKKSVSEDDSAVESNNPPPPVKRPKTQMAGKATAKVGIKATRKVGKKTKMAKKIEDETQGTRSKYSDIVKSMPTTRAGDGSNRKPASRTPSQA
jgi:hypothetical protein